MLWDFCRGDEGTVLEEKWECLAGDKGKGRLMLLLL